MKKLCLILFIAASLAGAAPRGSFIEHHRIPGLWLHTPPELFMRIFEWVLFHRFFMAW